MAGHKHVILCVDDEDNPLLLRKLVLEKAGYTVVTARSASEALELLAVRHVDLVLSDHLMPGTTGAELAQEMKTRFPATPFILISGVNDIPLDADSADAFMSKVEGPDKLCRRVAAVLRAQSSSASRSS
jgi:CheY-like chemotaxis protein